MDSGPSQGELDLERLEMRAVQDGHAIQSMPSSCNSRIRWATTRLAGCCRKGPPEQANLESITVGAQRFRKLFAFSRIDAFAKAQSPDTAVVRLDR